MNTAVSQPTPSLSILVGWPAPLEIARHWRRPPVLKNGTPSEMPPPNFPASSRQFREGSLAWLFPACLPPDGHARSMKSRRQFSDARHVPCSIITVKVLHAIVPERIAVCSAAMSLPPGGDTWFVGRVHEEGIVLREKSFDTYRRI